MATIVFYEKPGCLGNARQKALLRAAGHRLIVRDLLHKRWTPSLLAPFFQELPVPEWFNSSSPRVKHGDVQPELLSPTEALALMVEDPLLIRRPLIQVGDRRVAGFDPEVLSRVVSLGSSALQGPLEGCAAAEAGNPRQLPS